MDGSGQALVKTKNAMVRERVDAIINADKNWHALNAKEFGEYVAPVVLEFVRNDEKSANPGTDENPNFKNKWLSDQEDHMEKSAIGLFAITLGKHAAQKVETLSFLVTADMGHKSEDMGAMIAYPYVETHHTSAHQQQVIRDEEDCIGKVNERAANQDPALGNAIRLELQKRNQESHLLDAMLRQLSDGLEYSFPVEPSKLALKRVMSGMGAEEAAELSKVEKGAAQAYRELVVVGAQSVRRGSPEGAGWVANARRWMADFAEMLLKEVEKGALEDEVALHTRLEGVPAFVEEKINEMVEDAEFAENDDRVPGLAAFVRKEGERMMKDAEMLAKASKAPAMRYFSASRYRAIEKGVALVLKEARERLEKRITLGGKRGS